MIFRPFYYSPDDGGGGEAYVVPADLPADADDLVFEDDEADAQTEATTPDVADTAPVLSVSSLSDEDLAAEYNRRATLYNPQAPAPTPEATPNADPRLARVAELQEQAVEASYADPVKAEQMRSQAFGLQLEIQTDAIKKDLTAQFEQRFNQVAAQVVPITTERAINATGLGTVEQEFLREKASEYRKQGIDLAQALNDPLGKDLLVRAAKQYASEKTPARVPTNISAASESVNISAEDLKVIRDFEAMTGDKVGKDVVGMAQASNRTHPQGMHGGISR